ncbi:hypothetical protein G3N59_05480 [Paraburkholderia sp. Ac-20340]|uniref:hypothetical protein n=1 Tax=Paraburkholderia sp. Ac-20340 TaxID=2703888 RepID=UPI00197F2C0E|nr:hypothetical protein [Paraburkholderia sp. Ac-20340]MBN3852827.1 hypothetical protein [Paraburkholderia sp. Ac-20340]
MKKILTVTALAIFATAAHAKTYSKEEIENAVCVDVGDYAYAAATDRDNGEYEADELQRVEENGHTQKLSPSVIKGYQTVVRRVYEEKQFQDVTPKEARFIEVNDCHARLAQKK